MTFTELSLGGAFLIRPEPVEDERGFFARTWCRRELAAHGLNPDLAQCSVSWNRRRGTLRGMHFQAAPHQEAKLVRCTRGAIHDVIIDLRGSSPTCGEWLSMELTEENRAMLYVPEGFAHGFQTLVDGSEVFYQMTEFYEPGSARGIRWNDPFFGIRWPLADPILSPRDARHPDFAHAGWP